MPQSKAQNGAEMMSLVTLYYVKAMASISVSFSRTTHAGGRSCHPVSHPMGRHYMATVPKEMGLQSIARLEELKSANNHMSELGKGALPIRPSEKTATPFETSSQRYPAKPHLYCRPTEVR